MWVHSHSSGCRTGPAGPAVFPANILFISCAPSRRKKPAMNRTRTLALLLGLTALAATFFPVAPARAQTYSVTVTDLTPPDPFMFNGGDRPMASPAASRPDMSFSTPRTAMPGKRTKMRFCGQEVSPVWLTLRPLGTKSQSRQAIPAARRSDMDEPVIRKVTIFLMPFCGMVRQPVPSISPQPVMPTRKHSVSLVTHRSVSPTPPPPHTRIRRFYGQAPPTVP